MIQNLKDKLINIGGGSYDALINHINMQGDIINELVDKVNELDNQSDESATANVRLVDANSVKAAIKEVCDKYNIAYGYDGGFGEAIANVVDSQPTVETNEIVTSTWRWEFRYHNKDNYVCNNCNSRSTWDSHYCPTCGAKMIGVDHYVN